MMAWSMVDIRRDLHTQAQEQVQVQAQEQEPKYYKAVGLPDIAAPAGTQGLAATSTAARASIGLRASTEERLNRKEFGNTGA